MEGLLNAPILPPELSNAFLSSVLPPLAREAAELAEEFVSHDLSETTGQ